MNKRGFTIVELIIVISVIAILAAAIVPTFTSVIDRAHREADVVTLHTLNEELLLGDLNIEELQDFELSTKGWRLKYHRPTKQFVIVDDNGKVRESTNGKLNGEETLNNDAYANLDDPDLANEGIFGGETSEQWWDTLTTLTVLPEADSAEHKQLKESEELSLNVKNIPDNYFSGSAIKRINIGETEVIGRKAFENCKELVEVTGTAVKIEDKAFSGCEKLNKIDLSKTETIGRFGFYQCTSLQKLDLTMVKQMNFTALNKLELAELKLRPCEILAEDDQGTYIQPEFKVKRLEIASGEITVEFSKFLIELIKGVTDPMTIVVRDVTLQEGKSITPFSGAGENVSFYVDAKSRDRLSAETDNAFNGRSVTLLD